MLIIFPKNIPFKGKISMFSSGFIYSSTFKLSCLDGHLCNSWVMDGAINK